MSDYTPGSNVDQRPPTRSEIFLEETSGMYAPVTVSGETLPTGQMLITADGGLTWAEPAVDEKPNGILMEELTATGEASVLISGEVRGKHLTGFKEIDRQDLFNLKLIVR